MGVKILLCCLTVHRRWRQEKKKNRFLYLYLFKCTSHKYIDFDVACTETAYYLKLGNFLKNLARYLLTILMW